MRSSGADAFLRMQLLLPGGSHLDMAALAAVLRRLHHPPNLKRLLAQVGGGDKGCWEAVVRPAWDGSKTALAAGSPSGFGRRKSGDSGPDTGLYSRSEPAVAEPWLHLMARCAE